MNCQHVDYHADMYPEFAPDPIVVRCTNTAEWRITYTSVIDLTRHHEVLCTEHVSMRNADPDWAAETDDHTVDAITLAWAAGYDHGRARGEAEEEFATDPEGPYTMAWTGELIERFAAPACLSGEHAAESMPELGVLDDDDADEYEAGFEQGWYDALCEKAHDAVERDQ